MMHGLTNLKFCLKCEASNCEEMSDFATRYSLHVPSDEARVLSGCQLESSGEPLNPFS
jgi:hypothetical protein